MKYVIGKSGKTTIKVVCEDDAKAFESLVVEGWSIVETGVEPEIEEVVENMKYSTLRIKRELAKVGKWESAKALLTASGYWDDYMLANYLSETDEVFQAACAALVARGIVTDAELKELLPKCVWKPE